MSLSSNSDKLLVLKSSDWSHRFVEVVSVLVCGQIGSDSFKNEITYKLYMQTIDWCWIVAVI